MRRSNTVDITGQRFGRLTAVRPVEYRPGGLVWACRCDCGNETEVYSQNLRKGRTKSCGCTRNASISEQISSHGESRRGHQTAEFRTWRAMFDRCGNPNNKSYKYYGALGVTICARWRTFAFFLADMGRKPTAGHSLDRIDAAGNYTPLNCRWATALEQRHNRRST